MTRPIRVAILTVSDRGAVGDREIDISGNAIFEWAKSEGFEIVHRSVVADESDEIAGQLCRWADDDSTDLILTTGGTGLAARDVTPEATLAVIERDVPGIAESIRAEGGSKLPRAMLSRGVSGARGTTLIVNLPGSPGGVKDGLAVLTTVVRHAVEVLTEQVTDH